MLSGVLVHSTRVIWRPRLVTIGLLCGEFVCGYLHLKMPPVCSSTGAVQELMLSCYFHFSYLQVAKYGIRSWHFWAIKEKNTPVRDDYIVLRGDTLERLHLKRHNIIHWYPAEPHGFSWLYCDKLFYIIYLLTCLLIVEFSGPTVFFHVRMTTDEEM